MWGGGNSFGSAIPRSQSASQVPENIPIETMVQPTRESHEGTRSPWCVGIAGASLRILLPSLRSTAAANEAISRRLVFELAVEVVVFGDHLLKQRPIDRAPSRFFLDVAHRHQAVSSAQDKICLSSGIDVGGLLAHGELSVVHRRLVIGADDLLKGLLLLGFGHKLGLHHGLDDCLKTSGIFGDQVFA